MFYKFHPTSSIPTPPPPPPLSLSHNSKWRMQLSQALCDSKPEDKIPKLNYFATLFYWLASNRDRSNTVQLVKEPKRRVIYKAILTKMDVNFLFVSEKRAVTCLTVETLQWYSGKYTKSPEAVVSNLGWSVLFVDWSTSEQISPSWNVFRYPLSCYLAGD